MNKIMLVDDDDDIREGFAEVLRDAGYDVHEAENGRAALQQLEGRDEPCLLLVDLMMPEMGGAALLDELARANRLETIKVVALSASDAVHTIPRAHGFIPKPVLPEHLLEVVGSYCERADPRVWVS